MFTKFSPWATIYYVPWHLLGNNVLTSHGASQPPCTSVSVFLLIVDNCPASSTTNIWSPSAFDRESGPRGFIGNVRGLGQGIWFISLITTTTVAVLNHRHPPTMDPIWRRGRAPPTSRTWILRFSNTNIFYQYILIPVDKQCKICVSRTRKKKNYDTSLRALFHPTRSLWSFVPLLSLLKQWLINVPIFGQVIARFHFDFSRCKQFAGTGLAFCLIYSACDECANNIFFDTHSSGIDRMRKFATNAFQRFTYRGPTNIRNLNNNQLDRLR